MTSEGSIRAVSDCFIKPKCSIGDESKKSFYLGSFELLQMSHFYLQMGLLFRKLPPTGDNNNNSIKSEYIEKLKQSLRTSLDHFYALAGQLDIVVEEEQDKSFIYVDCNKGLGAKFIHACLDDVSVDDLASLGHIPTIVESLFDLGQIPTNYEGDKVPMLVVQVTELVDGMFLGVSANHAIVDGTSFWHWISSWSEIFQSNTISRPPVYERWFPEGHGPKLAIPLQILPNNNNKSNAQTSDGNLREVIFHLSSASIATLKEKANAQCGIVNEISSFQTLSAAIWRSVNRARQCHPNEDSTCAIVANARSRMVPPLSQDYLGSFLVPSFTHVKVSELLGNSLGSVALSVHQKVKDITFDHLHKFVVEWIESPFLAPTGAPSANSVVITGSLREDAHGIDFGLGKMVTVLTGSNKYDGKVVLHSEKEGRGSVSVQICLPSDALRRLERDQEFVSLLS